MVSKNTKNTASESSKATVRVVLSKAREAILADIEDPKERAKLRAKWVAKMEVQAEKNAAYLERRNNLEFVKTSIGMYAINGTGTRRNAIFTKAQALAFIERFDEFKALVEED